MHSARILVLLVLFVEYVHLFSWDIVVGGDKLLEFYDNGILTHTEVIPLAYSIESVTYDPVHYRLLFADCNYMTTTISSFDLSTRQIELLVTRTPTYYQTRVVYDPVGQALYWKEGPSIYSFSLSPGSSNKAGGNLLVSLGHYCYDVAVDSCEGHIYWIAKEEIGRARLDGSEREVLINDTVWLRLSLAIDQQTQKMYWTERTHRDDDQMYIESASFNGKNRTTLYIVRNDAYAFSLAVSKDFIYWQNYDQEGIWQLPKFTLPHVARKLHSISSSDCVTCHRIAVNFTIKEQIQEIKCCVARRGLIPYDSKSESTVSICQNYCFQGECSVSAEGQPTCSCKAGHSGERCEVNACHQYCLNGGVCSLNETDAPVCQCAADYEGKRCDVSAFEIKCIQTISMLKIMLNADVTSITLGKGVYSTCASTVV